MTLPDHPASAPVWEHQSREWSALAFRLAGNPDASVLSEPERARAARFHFERDRLRWIECRSLLRHRLGALLGVPAAALPVGIAEGGKPFLAGYPDFDFNLSHSGDWMALAWCRGGRIGIDIECEDREFPALEIAERFFLPEECQAIRRGGADGLSLFFRHWTAKEALMKASGRGMSLPPESIRVTLADGWPVQAENLEDASRACIASSEAAPGVLISVCHL